MKHTLVKLYRETRQTWLQSAVLRRLAIASALVLLLGFRLGGLRLVTLLIGYLQLVFRAALPGEPVESSPLQRASAFAGGLSRMLFFTGLMTHTAWPFLLMAAAQAAGLLLLRLGERTGTELSLLPLLGSSGFLVLALAAGIGFPAVWILLSGILGLTLAELLLHGKRTFTQLRMRFHLA